LPLILAVKPEIESSLHDPEDDGTPVKDVDDVDR
jgi:hypothetical protein